MAASAAASAVNTSAASSYPLPRELKVSFPVPSDLEIAQSVEPYPITVIADYAGIQRSELRLYGDTMAKVNTNAIMQRLKDAPLGRYVVVTAMSPTVTGNGKTTTTVGVSDALHLAGKKTVICLRQPSLGPVMGGKGAGGGGGRALLIPMEDLNLHLTGDIHAITAANNLLAAAIDTRILHERNQDDEKLYKLLTDNYTDFAPPMITRLKRLGITDEAKLKDPKLLTTEERVKFARLNIDPEQVSWRRVIDTNDRVLREIKIGQGPNEKGIAERTTGFDITVASELMAILSLCSNLADMRKRIGEMQVAVSRTGETITCEDIGCAGAMTVLMKDTVDPTLMQSLIGTPSLVHAGPFANIATGHSSIIADEIALRLVGKNGYVVTEAGFGADIGCEKFFDIKCRLSGLKPDAAIIVATVPALKLHGGVAQSALKLENIEAVKAGASNLLRHIENTSKFGVPSIVVVNRMPQDTLAELALVKELCKSAGVVDVVLGEHWAKGGAGVLDAVTALDRAPPSRFVPLYPSEMGLVDKIATIATQIYRAAKIDLTDMAKAKLADFEARGYKNFSICMAKTQYSFTNDPAVMGAPTGFTITVRDVRVSAGARFVVVLLGDMSTMPGLQTRPNYFLIDINLETGAVVGLS